MAAASLWNWCCCPAAAGFHEELLQPEDEEALSLGDFEEEQ